MLARAADALDAGVAIERVQGYYVARAGELLAEAEAQALLATEGSPEAVRAIESCLAELLTLSAELALEPG